MSTVGSRNASLIRGTRTELHCSVLNCIVWSMFRICDVHNRLNITILNLFISNCSPCTFWNSQTSPYVFKNIEQQPRVVNFKDYWTPPTSTSLMVSSDFHSIFLALLSKPTVTINCSNINISQNIYFLINRRKSYRKKWRVRNRWQNIYSGSELLL